jgi:hypothetical protein
MKSPITFVCLIVTLLLSGLSHGQAPQVRSGPSYVQAIPQGSAGLGCVNGRCYNSSGAHRGVVQHAVSGTTQVIGNVVHNGRAVLHSTTHTAGTIVTNTVRTTGAVVERVVDRTGQVLTATVDAAGNVAYTTARIATTPVRGLAQSKAERQAAMQRCCHVGGSFGGAKYEGVGFSTVSGEEAVQRCCYSNRSIRESGVAYGYNQRLRCYGWFATILCD